MHLNKGGKFAHLQGIFEEKKEGVESFKEKEAKS